MAKVEVLDVDENSLDNSADSEILGIYLDEGSLGSAECERSQLVSQSYLDNNEDNSSSYNFKDLSSTVAYKLIPMTGNQTPNNMAADPLSSGVLPSGEFYVKGNPVQVFGTETSQIKVIRRKSALQNKVITAKKHDNKRRATHNEVERRRRDKINRWITKLAALVPNSGLPDKASKSGILAKACDYITDLTEKQKKLEKLEGKSIGRLEDVTGSSEDSEILGIYLDEGSLGSAECERSQLVSQSYLDNNEDNSSSYNFKDLSNTVAYKLIPMTGNQTPNNMAADPLSNGVLPSGEFYVKGNPVQVFGTETSQIKVIRRKSALQNKVITAKKHDDKRRHNEVERRRRDKINRWITKLAALVPNSGLPDTASKGRILAKACDHITDLTEKQKKLEKLEVYNDKLVLEVLRLNQELVDLRKENSSMRSQLADNCVVSMPHRRARGQKS